MTTDDLDRDLRAALAPTPDAARLQRLREDILARTAMSSPASAPTPTRPLVRPPRLRAWLAPREWLPVAAGLIVALGLTWAVQSARPAEPGEAEVNPVLALIEYDATGLGVL